MTGAYVMNTARSEEIRFEGPTRNHYATMVVTTDRLGRECLDVGNGQLLELQRDEDARLFLRIGEEAGQ